MSEAGRRIYDALSFWRSYLSLGSGWDRPTREMFARMENYSERLGMDRETSLEVALTFLEMVASLNEAEQAFVTPEMCRLLIHAAETVPEGPFVAEDLPWRDGFVVLPILPGEDLPWLLHWGISSTDDGLVRAACAYRPDPPTTARIVAGHRDDGVRTNLTKCKAGEVLGQNIDTTEDEPNPAGRPADWRLLDTLWLLLGQRIAVPVEFHPDRATSRAFRRNQKVVPTLREITLRKTIPKEPTTESAALIDWSHRWIVGGHWRAQYYPSDDTHRRIWIAPYVKGPEDRPLVMKDRLYVWRR